MKDNKVVALLDTPLIRSSAFFSPSRSEGNNVRGFTLIELLVVVLIIGILAAVAVPQYQKAVEKSRAAEGFVLAKAIAVANTVYYLENGQYGDYTDLALDIPGEPLTLTENVHGIETKYFKSRTRLADGTQYLSLCNRRIDTDNSYSINFFTNGDKNCSAEGGKAHQVCRVLTGKKTPESDGRYSF